MAEEYKRKWHEHHDPRADKKEYLGTKLLDNIETGVIDWYQDERTLEGWEWLNPASVATAGAIRTVEGVGTVLTHTPLVSQGLQAIGKVEDVAAGSVGSLAGAVNLDPRFGGWAVRLASAWYGGKAITAASKTRTAQNLSKAAVKFGKIQADEIGMKAHTLLKKKHGKTYTRYPDDPFYPTVDVTDLKTRLDNSIEGGLLDDFNMMRAGLNPRRLMNPDGTPNLTHWNKPHLMDPELQLFNPKRRHLGRTGKMKSSLYRALDEQGLLGGAERVLSKIDEFRVTKNFGGTFNPERPTTGFRGTRTIKYKVPDGKGGWKDSEIGWRWSKSARGGLGDYKPYDVPTQLATVARRAKWNVNRNSRSKPWADKIFKNATEQNAVVKEALENLRKENPEYFWKVMGENYDATKGHIYVEHLHPQKSPVWIKQADGTFRHRITGHAPRDASNLLIVPGPEMGAVKTAIENILYNKPNNTLWLDFNRKRRVLVLRNKEGKWVGDISTLTNVENAERALYVAQRGHRIKPGKEGEIQEVIQADPKTPKRIEALDMEDDPRWKDIKD